MSEIPGENGEQPDSQTEKPWPEEDEEEIIRKCEEFLAGKSLSSQPDSSKIARLVKKRFGLAQTHQEKGENQKAKDIFLSLLPQVKEPYNLFCLYTKLALLFHREKNLSEEKIYLEKALQIAVQPKDLQEIPDWSELIETIKNHLEILQRQIELQKLSKESEKGKFYGKILKAGNFDEHWPEKSFFYQIELGIYLPTPKHFIGYSQTVGTVAITLDQLLFYLEFEKVLGEKVVISLDSKLVQAKIIAIDLFQEELIVRNLDDSNYYFVVGRL